MLLEYPRRIPILVLAIGVLLLAMAAGLVRLGFDLPLPNPAMLVVHGPLLVGGFLGTLIGLERAAALKKKVYFAIPLVTLLGAVWLIVEPNGAPGRILFVLGSLGVLAIMIWLVAHQPAPHTVLLAGGALSWVVGNAILVAIGRVSPAIPWWIAFLLLTVVGERLELNRVLPVAPRYRRLLHGALVVFMVGVGLATVGFLFDPEAGLKDMDGMGEASTSVWCQAGFRTIGVGLVLVALWLFRFDIVRRNISRPGLHRFVALCLLSGFFWLAVSGGLFVVSGAMVAGPRSDAMLHSFFLGFVMTMIFGHAQIIFPGVLGLKMAFLRLSYVPLVLLNLSLLLRLSGDLFGRSADRKWGALFNGVAILAFLVGNVLSLRRDREAS